MTRPGRQARQAPAGLPHRVLLSAYYDHRKARMICLLNGLMAAAILGLGAVLAVWLDSLNYINRMGGMITALSLLLALHQFRFEQRHKNEEALSAQAAALVAQDRHYPSGFAREVVGRARRGTAQRVESARQMIITSIVVIGLLGEVFNSFGDLLARPVFRALGYDLQ